MFVWVLSILVDPNLSILKFCARDQLRLYSTTSGDHARTCITIFDTLCDSLSFLRSVRSCDGPVDEKKSECNREIGKIWI